MVFGFFKGKKAPTEAPKELYLKSNEAAFEYAERYLQRPLVKDSVLVGYVIAPVQERPSALRPAGPPKYSVKLATEHGTLEVSNCGSIAESVAKQTGIGDISIGAGDLVAVEVAAYDPKYAADHQMNYFIIVAKLTPVLSIANHMFRVHDPNARK